MKAKLFKKATAIGLSVLLAAGSLTGCGSNGASADNTAANETVVKEAESGTEPAVAPEATGDGADVSAEKTGDGLVFKVIAMNAASPYWLSVKNGAEKAAEEMGSEYGGIKIEYVAPQEDTDTQKQLEMVENAISQGVDGILIAPCSPTVPHDAIVEAIDEGIKVIVIDQYLDPMDANGFFGTNGVNMCTELGEYIADNHLDGSGSYAEMVFNMTSLASIDRYNGFISGITGKYPDMKDVGYQITESDINKTTSLVANVYQANPDLKCIFANNDRTALGVLNGIKELGIEGQITVCAVDCNLDLLKAMREGTIAALSLQMPYNQGYEGTKKLIALVNGEEIEKESDSGSFLLTPDNMDTDEAVAAIQQYIDGYKPEDSK